MNILELDKGIQSGLTLIKCQISCPTMILMGLKAELGAR